MAFLVLLCSVRRSRSFVKPHKRRYGPGEKNRPEKTFYEWQKDTSETVRVCKVKIPVVLVRTLCVYLGTIR